MLGRHIFAHMGAGVKIYHGVDLTYGYNLSIGDGVIIRQRALLNDRGGITIGKGAIIGSFARVYSFSHEPGTTTGSRWCPPSSAQARASPATPSCWPASTSPPAKPSAASPRTAYEKTQIHCAGFTPPCTTNRAM